MYLVNNLLQMFLNKKSIWYSTAVLWPNVSLIQMNQLLYTIIIKTTDMPWLSSSAQNI